MQVCKRIYQYIYKHCIYVIYIVELPTSTDESRIETGNNQKIGSKRQSSAKKMDNWKTLNFNIFNIFIQWLIPQKTNEYLLKINGWNMTCPF